MIHLSKDSTHVFEYPSPILFSQTCLPVLNRENKLCIKLCVNSWLHRCNIQLNTLILSAPQAGQHDDMQITDFPAFIPYGE
jgi:hypothetical protein